ncbi:hypothetical protein PR002_g24974 [Phytophthora rubi]|uniref:Uncharacterized protein n=1 Tax=Phytophthora rubi TaxID=129364 RepID=A0A6A3I416_9STRA|nr:hypothetical protein PR002_g24974 [Phytophthora rubi]
MKAETSHPFGPGGVARLPPDRRGSGGRDHGSKKGTAGELPAEPLEAVREDEARDDEEVDESSPLESPELPGPGPDPPLAAM